MEFFLFYLLKKDICCVYVALNISLDIAFFSSSQNVGHLEVFMIPTLLNTPFISYRFAIEHRKLKQKGFQQNRTLKLIARKKLKDKLVKQMYKTDPSSNSPPLCNAKR